MIKEAIEFVRFLLATPAYMQATGLMFSTAVVLGGMLDGKVKSTMRVVVSLIVFVITSEFTRFALFPAIGQDYSVRPATLIALNALIYLAGYTLGWAIGVGATLYARKALIKQEERNLP